MKTLQFLNSSLADYITEKAVVKSPVTAGTTVTIVVDDNTDFAENDLILLGELGVAKTEIVKIGAAVVAGNSFVVDTVTFSHPIGTPVAVIPYDTAMFYYASVLAGTKYLQPSGAVLLDVQDTYTEYNDTTNTAGYAFITLYNSVTDTESDYSAAIPYATSEIKSTRAEIYDLVMNFWKRELSRTFFNVLCDMAEAEIMSLRAWKIREKSATFSTTAGTRDYTFAAHDIDDVGQILNITYNDLTVNEVSQDYFNKLLWEDSSQGEPSMYCYFADTLSFYPVPSEEGTIKVQYYRESAGLPDDYSKISVQLPQAVAFRILQDLWGMEDTQKSQYFERRYLQSLAAMKKNDKKYALMQIQLTDQSEITRRSINDQIEYPTITV